MYYYQIADLIFQSKFKLSSFADFICEQKKEAEVSLVETNELPPSGEDRNAGMITIRRIKGGWFYHSSYIQHAGLYVNDDYTELKLLGKDHSIVTGMEEWFVRVALECRLAQLGYVSLHSAAVEVAGGAYAFTGPSGVGKSTRAAAWLEAFSTKLINGDRPLVDVHNLIIHGVPWDGKEQCFRNVHYPLKSICEVRRSDSVYIRNMSFEQRRKLLIRQCFIPMWDTETAAIQVLNISRLAARAEIVRVFCGPTNEDARALYRALQEHQYLKEESDMRAKPGFVLRNVVDEYILMPTGDNIGHFKGTVLLNEVSAFVWGKLENPISREDLLKAILDRFEVEKAVASADLDALLDTLRSLGVIEED